MQTMPPKPTRDESLRQVIDAWDKTFHLRLSEMQKRYLVIELSKVTTPICCQCPPSVDSAEVEELALFLEGKTVEPEPAWANRFNRAAALLRRLDAERGAK
jgi:hypothetical protein